MASDDLRDRMFNEVGPALEGFFVPLSRRMAVAEALLAIVRPDLDRLGREVTDWRSAAYKHARERDDARAACRSAAVLLRSVADEGSDVGTLLDAARALDDVAGPVNTPLIDPVEPDTSAAGSGCWYCGCTATGDNCTCDHSKPTTEEQQ